MGAQACEHAQRTAGHVKKNTCCSIGSWCAREPGNAQGSADESPAPLQLEALRERLEIGGAHRLERGPALGVDGQAEHVAEIEQTVEARLFPAFLHALLEPFLHALLDADVLADLDEILDD